MIMDFIDFSWVSTEKPLSGKLVYRSSEYSLDFVEYSNEDASERAGKKGRASLAIGTLQIEVGVETGELLYPWGLFPLMHCKTKVMPMKSICSGEVFVDRDRLGLTSGVAIEIPGTELWEVFEDIVSGWICIGDSDVGGEINLVQFASGVVMSFRGKFFVALWVRPVME